MVISLKLIVQLALHGLSLNWRTQAFYLKPEPWEEVAEGKYKIKFSWKDETKPVIVDTEGTPVTDENVPVYSGSKVKFAFTKSLRPKMESPTALASS